MDADNVEYLPIWKKDSTPEEFLLELSLIARKHPERFKKIVIVFEETMLESDNTKLRHHIKGFSTNEVIGVLQIASSLIMESCER